MTPPNRTGGAGSAGGASTADTRPGPPVPPAAAVDAPSAAAGPHTTAGAVAPPTSAAPAVHDLPLVLVNSVYDGANPLHTKVTKGDGLGGDGPPGSSRRALTAGAAASGPAAPAVTPGGAWAMSLTLDKAHYVPAGTPILDVWFGRPVALALDGWHAVVDKEGLEDGARLPRCSSCTRELARMVRP